MDETRLNILNDSATMIGKLQLLSVFFDEELIYKIYMRSQVIHALFETNPELDINKLELFHLQFTASLRDLLKKIKVSNEKNVSLLYNEISLNKDMMARLNDQIHTEESYNIDKQRQALKVNQSLQKLYQVLSAGSSENPMAKNINSFSSRYAAEYFYTAEPEVFNRLITYTDSNVYTSEHAMIQKKLMGLLCKYEFRIAFHCGLKAGSQVLEIYKFMATDTYFLYFPSNRAFLLCDMATLGGVEWVNNKTKKENMINELHDKNDKLLSGVDAVKTHIPPAILQLLAENYNKIEDINFLSNLSNFDVQANILKTMLNTDII